jgi:hypothetical protein
MDERRFHPVQIVWIILWLLLLADCNNLLCQHTRDFQIRSSARYALIFWAVAVFSMVFRKPSSDRLAWTLGSLMYLCHVGLAFHYAHHWSHAKAFAHVEEAAGYGEGIYVSYFFTLVWAADALWWCCWPRSYSLRPAWLGWSVHGFMVFIIFNATVVFESGFIRWAGLALLVAIAAFWGSSRKVSVSAQTT